MYRITALGLVKCGVALITALAVCDPAGAIARDDKGRGKGGGSGRGQAAVRSEGRRDGGVRSGTSGSSGFIRSDGRQGISESRRESGTRREFTAEDRWRDGRNRDGHDHHDRWDRGSNFGIGIGVGPFTGFYGPWYRSYGPYGYYPSFGYYGPWSGYYVYDGPYYYGDGVASSSYYEPEPLPAEGAVRQRTTDSGRESMTSARGLDFLHRAEEAFHRGQYDQAARMANHAAVEMPNNAKLFLLLSQALFAVGDYAAAAGAAHQGMAMSDAKEWGTIVENFRQYYGDGYDYTEQLRRLEKFVTEHPDAPYGHFLVGFHYGFLGYPKQARRELAEAVRLEDRDELGRRLLVQFGGEAPARKPGDRRDQEVDRTAREERRDDREIRRDGTGAVRRAPVDSERYRESVPLPE